MSETDQAKKLFFQGLDHLDSGNFKAAETSFRETLALVPKHVPSLTNLAVVLRKQNRTEDSASAAKVALAVDGENIDALVVLADCCSQQKRYDESLDALKTIMVLDPLNAEAFSNQSFIFNQTGKFEESLASAERALAIDPRHPDALVNRGNALFNLDRYADALVAYDSTLAIYPDSENALLNRGNALANLKRHDLALSTYEKLSTAKPDFPDAWLGRGNVLTDLRRYDEALVAYDKALAIDPAMGAAWFGRGNAQHGSGRYEDAFHSYTKATQIEPDQAKGWEWLGHTCDKLKKYEAAIAAYDRTLAIAPNSKFVRGARFGIQKAICHWKDHDQTADDITARIERDEKVLVAFAGHNHADSPKLHQKITKLYTESEWPETSILPGFEKYPEHEKIRVGYFSADFREHAVAFQIAELIEQHDRSKFEIIAFSFGPVATDTTRERLRSIFDQFVDVTHLTDEETALLARRHEIDIAVDLMGYTLHSRTRIFSARAAPIQISYIGFPGTMSAYYFDYLLADGVVIPESQRAFYTEKIARLPDSYQVNSTKRHVSLDALHRAQYGLPEATFVFCSFNNSSKLNPQIFDDWMAILARVENSVLWLYAENADAQRNLRREAQARGLPQHRLIFVQHAPLPEHLARHRLADLVLDTFPYNGHATSSNALWTGLPILTRQGEAFPSRVGASLLHAIGLPELITTTREDYVALAVELAQHPDKLAEIKRKLAANRLTTPLFDIKSFTTHIEALYTTMYDRHRRDLPPADIEAV